MSSSAPPTPLQELARVTSSYHAYNIALAERLKGLPSPKPIEPSSGAYSVHCSICGKSGPPGETIFSGTMAAQRAGYTYDSASLRAGIKVRWFCPTHRGQR